MYKCVKCCSNDIGLRYVGYGEEWKGTSKNCGEFVSVSYEGYYVSYSKKEHIKCECNICGYVWRENTKDNKDV